MPDSVLEAIKQGQWDFEPRSVRDSEFSATRALPGSQDKLKVMAERLKLGLPLWHPSDVMSFEDLEAVGEG